MKYDFLAIGDVVTDAFVRLFDNSAEVTEGEHPKLCLGYGDKIPFEAAYVIPGVGNSANAAVAASRLGLRTGLAANIGNDYHGGEIIKGLAKENVGTELIKAHDGRVSNYHYVLWYKDDRTILVRHEEYPYELQEFDEPAWMYLSSLGENSLPFHKAVAQYLKDHPAVKLAFQPGTFQMRFGKEKLKELYENSEVLMCNREEAQIILEIDNDDIKYLAKNLRALGPEIVVITDGKDGSYTLEESKIWFMRPYPDPKPPLERTGAGDAYSSTFIAALALGFKVEDAMRWAPINSMSVVQHVGAQKGLLTRPSLEKYLVEAPADYIPKLFAEI